MADDEEFLNKLLPLRITGSKVIIDLKEAKKQNLPVSLIVGNNRWELLTVKGVVAQREHDELVYVGDQEVIPFNIIGSSCYGIDYYNVKGDFKSPECDVMECSVRRECQIITKLRFVQKDIVQISDKRFIKQRQRKKIAAWRKKYKPSAKSFQSISYYKYVMAMLKGLPVIAEENFQCSKLFDAVNKLLLARFWYNSKKVLTIDIFPWCVVTMQSKLPDIIFDISLRQQKLRYPALQVAKINSFESLDSFSILFRDLLQNKYNTDVPVLLLRGKPKN